MFLNIFIAIFCLDLYTRTLLSTLITANFSFSSVILRSCFPMCLADVETANELEYVTKEIRNLPARSHNPTHVVQSIIFLFIEEKPYEGDNI